jgi:hypothetical protein
MAIVVVANRFDAIARQLVARWAQQDALVLTCEDLSTAGWRYTCGGATDEATTLVGGRAVISGRALAVAEIVGVYTRTPSIFPQELTQIVPADREYIAAEMTAFLTWWLNALPGVVVSRPTATSLAGPGWRPEQWIWAAARAGLPIVPIHSRVAFSPDTPITPSAALAPHVQPPPHISHFTLTLVGGRCFGPNGEELDACDPRAIVAQQLARVGGVDLLAVQLIESPPGWAINGVIPWPNDLSDSVAEALCAHLTRPQRSEGDAP